MVRDSYKLKVKTCLEESDYIVTVIEEVPRSKRADLLATSIADSLIVEAKCKYDDDDLDDQLNKVKPRHILACQASLQRNNSLTSIIKEASRQIEASKHLAPNAFGLLWFHPAPKVGFSDSDEQIRMNLYGGRYAFVDAPDGSEWCMPCYYTTYSDFFRYRSLEGVALHGKQGVQLLPNPFSPRAEDFKKARLYRDFSNHSALWTPESQAAEGRALCLRAQVDLKYPQVVRSALEQQNPGHRIVSFVPMYAYGGVMKV